MANRAGNVRGVDTRERLLTAGLAAFQAHGYAATGVDAIARGAGVPKGSFYNHFGSKGAFAAEVVDSYFDLQTLGLLGVLSDRSRPALERLRDYFADRLRHARKLGLEQGCLMGNLAIEVADHEPGVRERLAENFRRWTASLAGLIREAQAAGDIENRGDPAVLAGFLVNAWQGALMRMRVEHSEQPLEDAIRLIFDGLLRARPASSTP